MLSFWLGGVRSRVIFAADLVGKADATAAVVLPFTDGEFSVEFNEYTLIIRLVLFMILYSHTFKLS